jgi:outer membrane protein insertion porin family
MMRGLAVVAVVMVFGCGFSEAADVNVGIPNATPTKLATQKKPLQLKALLAGFDKGASENSVAQLPTASPVVVSGDAVTEVLVTGNFSLSQAFLLDQAAVKPGDALNPFLINRAIRNLRSLGVFADVTSEVKKTPKGKVLVLTLSQNPKIREVIFAGNRSLTAATLREGLKSQAGGILNLSHVRDDLAVLRNQYEKSEIRVSIRPVLPEEDHRDLTFEISEATIGTLSVTGNTRTQAYVITREMTTKPGDVLIGSRIREDLRRVFNLGYFTNLEPQFLPGESPDLYDMMIQIEEKATQATFSLGGGYSPLSGFSLFTNFYWDNIMGTGQLGMLNLNFGKASTYQIKYVNPWMWDERKSLSVKAWVRDGEVDSLTPGGGNVVFRNEFSQGAEVGIGWPLSYELTTDHSVKAENVHLRDVNKRYTIHSYRFGMGYDTRDVRFSPTSGSFHTFSIEKSFVVFHSSLDYTKYDVEFRQFFPTFEKQTIAVRLGLGLIQSPQLSDADLYARELYRVGGSSTVRGWNDYSPFGIGNKMVLTSLEYRFLFSDMFQMVLFTDIGNATSGAFSLADMRMGKGLGFRIQTPLGPIRLDWGIGDAGDSYVHFNIGHSF